MTGRWNRRPKVKVKGRVGREHLRKRRCERHRGEDEPLVARLAAIFDFVSGFMGFWQNSTKLWFNIAASLQL